MVDKIAGSTIRLYNGKVYANEYDYQAAVLRDKFLEGVNNGYYTLTVAVTHQMDNLSSETDEE